MTKTVQVKLTNYQHDRITDEAMRTGQRKSAVARNLIEAGIMKQELDKHIYLHGGYKPEFSFVNKSKG